jgi:hypothetical protein
VRGESRRSFKLRRKHISSFIKIMNKFMLTRYTRYRYIANNSINNQTLKLLFIQIHHYFRNFHFKLIYIPISWLNLAFNFHFISIFQLAHYFFI